MKSNLFRKTLVIEALAMAGAIGLAASASVALAQPSPARKPDPSPPASNPADVKGVTVEAPQTPDTISPAKRSALDAQAARRKACKNYRNAAPVPASAPGAGGPGQSPNTDNFPGLQCLRK